MEPDGSRDHDQGAAEQDEQKPPDQEVTVNSQKIVDQQTEVLQENDDRNVAEKGKTTTLADAQTSRYPKRNRRRPPHLYGGFHYYFSQKG